MSDDTPTPSAPEPKADDWTAPASQDELNSIIEKRLARERAKFADYDDVKAKAAEFDKAQEANKTELEKAIEKAQQAENALTELRLEADRSAVALAKGLTPTQAKRLVGNTREALEADADELLADLKASAAEPPRAPDQKRHTTPATPDADREFVGQLFGRR